MGKINIKEKFKNNLPLINTILLVMIVVLCAFILLQQKQIKDSFIQKSAVEAQSSKEKEQLVTLSLSELINIDFDKDKMAKVYKESEDYCEDYQKEGTGSSYICQEKYIQKNYSDLFDEYNKITEFCTKNVAYYAHSECCKKVIDALKDTKQSIKFEEDELIR